jgi:hypothetical protein
MSTRPNSQDGCGELTHMDQSGILIELWAKVGDGMKG